MSQNPNHFWKRVDVAMLLLGIFNEDIQMYCIRNPQTNITDLIPALINLAFQSASSTSVPLASPSVTRLLKGRMLWCAAACSECVGVPTE